MTRFSGDYAACKSSYSMTQWAGKRLGSDFLSCSFSSVSSAVSLSLMDVEPFVIMLRASLPPVAFTLTRVLFARVSRILQCPLFSRWFRHFQMH